MLRKETMRLESLIFMINLTKLRTVFKFSSRKVWVTRRTSIFFLPKQACVECHLIIIFVDFFHLRKINKNVHSQKVSCKLKDIAFSITHMGILYISAM